MPMATDTPSPAPTTLTTATLTPEPTPAPHTLITELLIDPAAVSDTLGEWIEVHNAGGAPVNLSGWTLGSLERAEHTITADLWLEPGAYTVLARSDDPTANGGVTAAY